MTLSVVSQPTSVVVKLNAIVNIHKSRGLNEQHHFIPMAMEVHPCVIWIVSLGNVFFFFMIHDREVIYPHLFAFNLQVTCQYCSSMCFSLCYREEDCIDG